MFPEPERLPVDTVDFWRRRVFTAIASGKELHTVIYVTDYEHWRSIQNETTGILKRLIRPGQKVLDAGCGYGALYECFNRPADYWGVDISPDLIYLGSIRNPRARLELGDLRNLGQYRNKFFDWVVCRSVQGMTNDHFPEDVWEQIEKELRRVSRQMLLMEYGKSGESMSYKIIDTE